MFVHLNVHSEYSLADSTIRVKPLIKRVGELGMPAVALTDLHNTFALVKFFRAAEGAGIKPIAGADVWVASPEEDDQQYRLTLLCQDHGGFLSLSRLLSEGYAHRQLKTLPVVQQEWVEQEQSGLIALAGGRDGEFGHHIATGRADLARESLTRWMSVFDDDRFYVDIARLGRPGEEGYNDAALALANQAGCPVVATNDVRFMGSDDFDAHEARVCIATGRVLNDSSRPRNYTPEQYLKSPVEMQERFADLPGALDNAVELAKRCNLELKLGTYFLPEFPVPEGRTVESHLELESQAGLERRVERRGIAEGLERSEYDDRLALELGVINQMGFPGYFLIVADFIQWAKDHDIPVGPGRGSGAGSLVAYALGITDLDPLEYDLLFERFLNPERVSMPDFDVDFCMDRRDEVIDYVGDHYGRDRVCQIITYGSMNAKAVIRDVGRVLGHPYGYVDSIAKLIPPTLGIKLDEAIAESEELRERMGAEEDVGELVELALKLEGLTRNAGKHAGGVVIAPGPLTDFSPLYSEAGGESVVTQFDKDDVESAGLVKFDFLGLRTLTIIDWALAAINKRRGAEGKDPLDINKVPMDDPGTFELLQSTKTTAVFQLESRGMKELIGRLKPESFDDIVALVALYRPGPLDSGMVDTYVDCKHGRQDVVYPHESLEEILNTTYGVILYQEQVMQIAQVLSGYTLGGADILRRAMGKKKPEEMAKQRATFVDGAKGNDVDPQVAESIFDLIEKFAGYGFNKSHSAAYALLSYQTAYLKHHHAADFMAAVMSSDMDSTDKVVNFIDDARATGLDLEPPNVNRSRYPFVASDDHTIVYGLGAIKGVGHSAIDAIIEVREEDGPYKDLLDFCRRIDLGKVNRRVIEALIQAGAMDDLGPNRATLLTTLPEVLKAAEQEARDKAAGQSDMFGAPAPVASGPDMTLPEIPEMPELERLQAERSTLGLFLTGHPITPYVDDLSNVISTRLGDLGSICKPAPQMQDGSRGRPRGQLATIAGLVMAIRKRDTSMIFTLDDQTGRAECVAFGEAFQQAQMMVERDVVIVVEGNVTPDEYTGGFSVRPKRLMTFEEAVREHACGIRMAVHNSVSLPAVQELLAQHRGRQDVWVEYTTSAARATFKLGEGWRVAADPELAASLAQLDGVDTARVLYARDLVATS